MTNARERKGKFYTGACFLCMEPETPDRPLVERRWKLYRIWLCQYHDEVVRQRMKDQAESRERVLNEMMDSVLDSLGPALGLNIEGGQRARRPKSEAEAEEIAAAERMDQEDLDDMAYVARAAVNEKCSVCGLLGDQVELHEREEGGKTILVCADDERAILKLVDQGWSWQAAAKRVSADLFQAMLDPEITKEVRRRLRGE